jgi:hypothetical protein
MNKLLAVSLGVAALSLPGVAQVQRASQSVQLKPAAYQWQNDDDRRHDDDDRRDRDRDRDGDRGHYGRRDYRGVLQPESQRAFDEEYSRWIAARNSGNRRDMESQEQRMRGIMQSYKIPQDVPFDAIASNGIAGGRDGYYGGRDNDYDRGRGGYYRGARLSSEDQGKFDSLYSKWVNDTRRGDRDDADRDVKHMQEIMRRNNVPPDIPFDQVASNGAYRR